MGALATLTLAIGALVTGTLLIVVPGCSDRVSGSHDSEVLLDARFAGPPPMRITCTVGMLSDITAQIVGERGTVESLLGPGTDPHLYKASPGDVRKLLDSDLVLYCGHHLEGRMAGALERLDEQRPTLAVCERIPRPRLLRTEGSTIDPHLWFDVVLWKDVALIVRDALIAFDPEGATGYRARTDVLVVELLALDREVREQLALIPQERRTIVTAHDAFRYFGMAYGIEVVGIQGLSTESEAAVHRINELVQYIVQRRLPAVFVESTISKRNVLALVEGCKARGHELRIGGELYSDAMGKAGTPDETYMGMVRHNVRTIVEALR